MLCCIQLAGRNRIESIKRGGTPYSTFRTFSAFIDPSLLLRYSFEAASRTVPSVSRRVFECLEMGIRRPVEFDFFCGDAVGLTRRNRIAIQRGGDAVLRLLLSRRKAAPTRRGRSATCEAGRRPRPTSIRAFTPKRIDQARRAVLHLSNVFPRRRDDLRRLSRNLRAKRV
jgi:hypothetical protein